MVTLQKKRRINADSVIIDGFWGCGKTLLYSILPVFENILRAKHIAEIDWIYVLRNYKQIDKNASLTFLNNIIDNSIYNSYIGRETNLRWSDNSGLKYSDNKLRDISLLFSKEGESVVEEIEKKKIAQCLWTHNICLCNNSIMELFDKNMYFIKIIRNPIFVINNYCNFLERFNSSKIFTPSFTINSDSLPWFTSEYKNQLDISNNLETAIICIVNSYENYFQNRIIYKQELKIEEISFENLVINTIDEVTKIEKFLNRKFDKKKLNKILKRHKIPRVNLIEGLESGTQKQSLKSFDFIPKNDQDYCKYMINILDGKISQSLFKRFLNIIEIYQNIFPFFKYKI